MPKKHTIVSCLHQWINKNKFFTERKDTIVSPRLQLKKYETSIQY
jgi:hypothetical protein